LGFPTPPRRGPVQHLPTEEELEARARRWRYLATGAVLAALATGIFISRFLIP
jgi:hypothetical protein